MKFKKSLAAVLSLTALFSMSTALVGCKKDKQPEPENPSVTNDDETIVQSALDSLTVKSTVTEDFTLAIQGAGGVTISWSSANVDLIKIVGANATVVRPADKDTAVELTATATLNSVEKTKKFTVTVTKQEDTSITIAEALASADDSAVEIKGVVTGIVKKYKDDAFSVSAYWVTDATGTIYVYDMTEVADGNLVSIKGTKSTHNGLVEIKNAEVTVVKESEATPEFAGATETTIKDLLATEDGCLGKVYKFTATVSVNVNTSKNYTNFQLKDGSSTLGEYVSGSLPASKTYEAEFADYYANKDKTVVVYYAVQGKTNQGTGNWRGTALAMVEPTDADKALAQAATALNAVADEFYAVAEVTLPTDATFSVAENNYCSVADGKLKITAIPDEAVQVALTASATVNGATKEATKNITLTQPSLITIEEVLAAEKDTKVVTKGTISVANSKGFIITDGAKGIYVYLNKELPADYKVGDVVQVSGTKDLYYKGPQIKNAQLTKLTEAVSANPACVTVDAAKITSYLAAETQYEIFMGTATGTYKIDGTHREIVVEGHNYPISLDYLTVQQETGYDVAKDQKVVVEGWIYTANTKDTYVSMIVTKVSLENGTELVPTEPTVAPNSISFADKAIRTTFTTEQQVWVQNGITVTNNKASSTTNVGDYANPARFYKSSDLIISAEKNMTSITFHYVDANGKTNHPETLTIEGCTFTLDTTNQTFTITMTTPANSLTITGLGLQWRIASIDVVYAE